MCNNRIRQLEKKEIIVKNALQIIDHFNNLKFPRWKEFINRKIDTLVSTVWQLYTLDDDETARLIMHKIAELEMIRDAPELALGIRALSITDTVQQTQFKHIRLPTVYDHEKINAMFPIVNPKEKKYNSIEEARRNRIGGAEYCIDFTPGLEKYNKIVATHYKRSLRKDDIFALIAASMFYCDFSDHEIMETLKNTFNYQKKEIPSPKNLRYVAIVWGNNSTIKSNQATLSIPCEEMAHNQDNGLYHIYFNRGYTNHRDVEQYTDDIFTDSKYSNFSEIYSAKFNGGDFNSYCIDNFYAIFA